MNKETEISHLQALGNGDTYFAQFFKQDDIERMVQNIKNDFPIELGCSFVAKTEALAKVLKETEAKAEQEKFDTAVAILAVYSEGDIPEPILDILQNSLGSGIRLIEAKTAANVPPTREEVEYLIWEAKNK